ncbi:uncharacterized protein B0H18DRAFT_1029979 [Fomitopsis serialis]|uniref:uncharacterized protein n=1 Tax=Fomitopsis serialis TaxID=139415 RepID=UPI002007F9A9|nr:uncharacterized protein B0H18DRAFT_1029979 [Neoantrodia serialis]KAH9918877.1 hypothetical protein B0H18DRAFT_1029979 [Neoantrodia serialis]
MKLLHVSKRDSTRSPRLATRLVLHPRPLFGSRDERELGRGNSIESRAARPSTNTHERSSRTLEAREG